MTTAQMETFMSQAHPGTMFDFGYVPVSGAREAMQEIYSQMQKFPEVAKEMVFVGTADRVPDDINQAVKSILKKTTMEEMTDNPSVRAQTASFSDFNGRSCSAIIFNPNKLFPERLNKQMLKEAALGWGRKLKPGVTGIQYVAAHEFGHAVFSSIARHSKQGIYPYYDANKNGKLLPTVNNWWEAHKGVVSKVSGYANAGGANEVWAEAFVQMKYAVRPSALSNSMKKLFPYIYQENGVLKNIESQSFVHARTAQDAIQTAEYLRQLRDDLGMAVGG